MKRFKKILSFVMAFVMVIGLVQVPMDVHADETAAEYIYGDDDAEMTVLQTYALSNSYQTASSGDGPASLAFNATETDWWHSNYSTATDTNVDGAVSASNPVWIQSGFGETKMVSKVAYAPRTNGNNQIGQYTISVANLEDATATPADSDWTVVAVGTREASADLTTMDLAAAVPATHVRITAYSKIGGGSGHLTARTIQFYVTDITEGAGYVDKTQLLNAISTTVETPSRYEYTAESIATYITAYNTALASAQTVVADASADQTSVDAAATALASAAANTGLLVERTTVPEVFTDTDALTTYALANSEQNPAAYTNDGAAAWAFDGDTSHWWHSRYQGTVADHEVSSGAVSADNPIWIQTGFGIQWVVEYLTYVPRTGANTVGKDYTVYVANLSDPTATPTDDDFTAIVTGTLENVEAEQTIDLEEARYATHVRLEFSSVYNNNSDNTYVTAKTIQFYGYAVPEGGCAHETTRETTVEATCTEAGYVEVACSTCGTVISTTTTSEALGHDKTEVPAVEAGTIAAGNIQYWTCSRCEGNYATGDSADSTLVEGDVVIANTSTVTYVNDGNGITIPEDIVDEIMTLENLEVSVVYKFNESATMTVPHALFTLENDSSFFTIWHQPSDGSGKGRVSYAYNGNESGLHFGVAEQLVEDSEWHKLTMTISADAMWYITYFDGTKTMGWSTASSNSKFWNDSLMPSGNSYTDVLIGEKSALTYSGSSADIVDLDGTVKSITISGIDVSTDAAAAELNNAVAAQATAAYEAKVAECDAKVEDEYTSASWEAFEAAVAAVETPTTEWAIYNAIDDLDTAIALLAEDTGCTHGSAQAVAAVAATCTTDGSDAYWACPDCGLMFSDEALTTEILEVSTVAATGHTTHVEGVAAGETTEGTIEHWTCTNACCDADAYYQGQYTMDTYDSVTIAATGTNLALGLVPTIHHVSDDSAAGYSSGRPLSWLTDGDTNTNNYVDCHSTDGSTAVYVQLELSKKSVINTVNLYRYTGYTYTATAIAISESEDFSNPTVIYNSDTDGSNFNLGNGTDTTYVETTDGLSVSPATPVEGQYVRFYFTGRGNGGNDDTHVLEVEVMGYGVDCAHANTTTDGYVAATCRAAGYTGDTVCDDCGETITTGESIAVTAHVLTLVEAVDATLVKDGLAEHYVCSNECCSGYYYDEDGTEVSAADLKIDATGLLATENMSASASGTGEGDVANVFDGDATSFWTSETVESVAAGNPYLLVDLGATYSLGRVDYTPRWYDGPSNYWYCTGNITTLVVEVSTDGENWTAVTPEAGFDLTDRVVNVRDTSLFPVAVEFESVAAKYVRISGMTSYHWQSPNTSITVADLAFYGELNECTHENTEELAAVAPSCTTSGLTAGTKCTDCGVVITAQQEIAALGHTEEVDAAVPATCTTTGLTAGSHCSECGETIVAQEVVDALGHDMTEHAEVPATATEAGTNAYWTCSRCEGVLYKDAEGTETYADASELVIPALGVEECTHANTEVLAAVGATCTTSGLTEGTRCTDCGVVITAQQEIAALEHDIVTDAAVPATCTTTGLTEGSHCSRCNDATVAQEVVDALGHDIVTDAAVAPSCTTTGLTEGSHCSRCNDATVAQEEVAALGHSYGEYTEDTENDCHNRTCSVCNDVVSEAHFWVDGTCEKCGAVAPTADHSVVVFINGNQNDAQSQTGVKEGMILTVTAPAVDGKVFSHWSYDMDGNNRISSNKTYTFYVTKDMYLYANYADAPVEKLPSIVVSNTYNLHTTKYYVVIEVTRDIPSDYKVVEQGILYGTNEALGTDTENDLTFADAEGTALNDNVKKYKGTSTSRKGALSLKINLGTTDANNDRNVYARGYVVVEKDGVRTVVYTAPETLTYNGLN